MSLKNTWTDKVDGVDDVLAKDINDIAGAVIQNEDDIQELNKNKQENLTEKQLKNIEDVTKKQDELSAEQLQNIADVTNKVDKEQGKTLSTNDYTDEEKEKVSEIDDKADKIYVDNNFANALKGIVSGASVSLTDVSPIEHNMSVKLRNKNIISYPYNDTTKTTNGITFTDNGDGTITANGTATGTATFALLKAVNAISLGVGEKYTVSGAEGGSQSTYFIGVQDTTYKQTIFSTNGSSTAATLYDKYYFFIRVMSGTVCDNVVFRPTLVKGETYEGYLPYVTDLTSVSLKVYDNEDGEPIAEYTPLADGTVENVVSVYPTTILSTNESGLVIDCEYNKDLNKIYKKVEQMVANNSINAEDYGLPILKVSGDTSSMTKDVSVTLDYVYGTLSGSCTMKWQGSSSLRWEKKNYTIKFDNPFEAYDGWGEQKKYCLKANYIDFSHARNIVSAKLWGQVVKSRTNANEKLNVLVNGGAVDGFPICLFINGEYQGIYTFNIPKDGWMFGMGGGTSEAIVCAEGPANVTVVAFKKADVALGTDYSVEYAPNEDDVAWIKTSLDTMISACVNSDGTDLDSNVAQYLDWDSVIDYYIFTVLQNGFDGLFKNYLLTTYDGTKWFFSAYDMDSTYGLYWDGSHFVKTNEPYNNRASIVGFANNHRAMNLVYWFKRDELKSRYAELRAGVLSEDNVATTFANFIGGIPKALYDKECTIWKGIPSTATNNLNQITDFYRRKCIAIDSEIENL